MSSGNDDSVAGGSAGDARRPSDQSEESSPRGDIEAKYDRDLGVIEAITYVTRACPSGVVVRAAEAALDAIKAGGRDAMKQQAYVVLTTIKGWRGERATQVHRSLSRYLEQNPDDTSTSPSEQRS